MLTWEVQGNNSCILALTNGNPVGFIVARDDGAVVWNLTAVHSKWICKGYGEAKSVSRAKASLRRAWNKWLSAYGLVARHEREAACPLGTTKEGGK